MKRGYFQTAVLCLVLAGSVTTAAGTPSGPPEPRFELTEDVARLIRDGQRAMYGNDFPSAAREFDALVRRYPGHPAGYMYQAACVWWQCLLDRTNPELQARFLGFSDRGIAGGEALVAADPRDFYARMFLAGLYGNLTRFHVTITGNRLDAIRAGLKGNRYNRQALALRPGCADCLIGTGSYAYAPAAIPAILKPFAAIVGIRADKDRSLEELQTAVQKGDFARTEAKLTLLGIYFNEHWDDRYEALLLELLGEYPSNCVFYRWLAEFYLSRHRYRDGIRYFTTLLAGPLRDTTVPSARGYATLEKGRLELQAGEADAARESLTRGLEESPPDKVFLARARLLRGFALDAQGRREQAVGEYRAVLALPDVEGTRRDAAGCLRNPYKPGK